VRDALTDQSFVQTGGGGVRLEPMALKRLRYVSKARSGLTEAEIATLVDSSDINNSAREITGVLIYANGHFFQVLEGPDEAVDALYAKIANDDRHSDVMMLDAGVVEERLYASWGMRWADGSEQPDKRLEAVGNLVDVMVRQRDSLEHSMNQLQKVLYSALAWYEEDEAAAS
jgi:hypothetical protein